MNVHQQIVFTRPCLTGTELTAIADAIAIGRLSGDGEYTHRCSEWLTSHTGCSRAFLTTSGTAALEMAALLLSLEPGDEIIMPSFTFSSTANAVVMQRSVPVFVDVRRDTLNIDDELLEEAVTPRTKAIMPVHYAGVSCEMDSINRIAEKYGLGVIEDAAQGILASYKGKPLGTLGDLSALSFHETKNVVAGEAGALLVNDERYAGRAEIIREKGTNRSQFLRGEIDKYTWYDIGSSFLPNELTAAFLYSQLCAAEAITASRLVLWNRYHHLLEGMEEKGFLTRPTVPDHCLHNAHIYYVVLASHLDRNKVIRSMRSQGVIAASHYVPLHSSPAGLRFGRVASTMGITDFVSSQIVRLPLWIGLTGSDQERVLDALRHAVREVE